MSETFNRMIIGGAGLAVGLAAGIAVASAIVPSSAEEAPPRPVAAAPAVPEPPPPTAMVCAASSGDAEALWSRWCEAQLAEQARRAEMVRVEWPTDLGTEAPQAWMQTLEQAIADCALPLAIDTVECTEYPCLATVQVHQGADVDAALSECATLDRDMGDLQVGVQPSKVRCPDGSLQDVDVLYAYSGDTLESVVGPAVPDGTDRFFEEFRLLSRRVDDVVTTHGCDE